MLLSTKTWLLPSCLTQSLTWLQTTYWKQVSLTAFRQILPNTLTAVHIFSFIITTYLKKSIGIKSLSTKDYTFCIPNLTENVPPPFILLVTPTMYGLPCSFSQTYYFGRIPIDGGRILLRTKHPAPEKSPSPSNNFSWNYPKQASFIAVVVAVVSIFLTSDFIYRYIMLTLISWWLLNLICSLAKEFNDQDPSPTLNAIWKTILQLLLVFLFTPSLFISNL